MSSMNTTDIYALREMRETLRNVAKEIKTFSDRGIMISFNLNGVVGELEEFTVRESMTVDIDLTYKN